MPRCPDCNERVPSGETVCPHCGSAMSAGRRGSGSSKSNLPLILGIVAACLVGVCLCAGLLIVPLMLPAVQQARFAARSAQSKNNLKQIGLALHNYADQHTKFPAGGTFLEDGQGQHGWMTALLPFVEQSPLYDRVDFKQPWNAEQNRAVFAVQVKMYLNPNVSDVAIGPDGYALAHYAGNSLVLGKNQFLRFGDFKDGASYTVLAAEVPSGFKPWGSPENVRDLSLGLGSGPDQFGPAVADRTNVLLGDGSVKTLSGSIDPAVLKALATPDGGEQPGDF